MNKKSIKYIVLVNRTGAKFFRQEGINAVPEFVEELEHPEGRLKTQDLVSDKPGRSFESSRRARNELSPHEKPKDHLLKLFAEKIADKILTHKELGNFENLVLVADGHILGVLRQFLNTEKKLGPIREIRKNLYQSDSRDLLSHLKAA